MRCESEGFAAMFEEAIEVEAFKDGRFPGNVEEDNRSITKMDKNNVF